MAIEPITRAEQIMSGESLEPITREEMFLAKAAGMDVATPTPITRREMFLSKISGGSGGGGEYEAMLAGVVDKTITHLVVPSSCDHVGSLTSMSNLQSLVIKNGAKSIEPYACVDMMTLESVKIAGSVKTIGMSAFSRCASLHTLEMENGIETINTQMCNGCTALENVVIPETVKYIHSIAFSSEGLRTVTFKGKPESIATGPPAFGSSTITDIYVPWAEGEVSGAPWGAKNATVHYNHMEG